MKKISLPILAMLCLAVQAQVQVTDTIVNRCGRFYYDMWYDECPSFQTPDHLFSLNDNASFPNGPSNHALLVQECYTPQPLTLYGLAAMLILDPGDEARAYGADPDSLTRAMPEQLMLFQALSNDPRSPYLFPPQLRLLDSVRWDTAAPHLLRLPRNMYAVAGDSTAYVQCLLYEVRFPNPITVDSSFYIGGTFHNTVTDTSERLCHLPTVYQSIVEDPGIPRCNSCQPVRRLFRNSWFDGNRFRVSWLLLNDRYAVGGTFGPFLPVTAP